MGDQSPGWDSPSNILLLYPRSRPQLDTRGEPTSMGLRPCKDVLSSNVAHHAGSFVWKNSCNALRASVAWLSMGGAPSEDRSS